MVVDMTAEDNFRLKSNMSGMNPSAFWKVVRDGGHYQYMFNSLQINKRVKPSKMSQNPSGNKFLDELERVYKLR